MKITRIRDAVAPIPSPMRNAVISFDKMTISIVAIETDVVRNGRPLIGLGFCSNGRYAQSGILRERLIPRVLEAAPEDLLDESGGNVAPERVWCEMMRDEKPGGHGDRAVAAGALDMAVWDLVAKVEEKPLWKVLSERSLLRLPRPSTHRCGFEVPLSQLYDGGSPYHRSDHPTPKTSRDHEIAAQGAPA